MREPGPGTRLGQYRLVAPIGAGGMGRVWAALDEVAPALRLVAIKVALEGEGSDEKYWSALSDEASVAARIGHPNVCSTYELGVEDGVHFLVMEWSDGASLRDLLDAVPGKRVTPQLAAQIGASVAAGLHAAHELCEDDGRSSGVVHRDVSPQNVLISMRGTIRLADFGVAKARGQIRRPTETGELKGKLSYMAPEQISSKLVDRRADVFALACVIYEMALGVRAFHGADALSTMYLILEQPVASPRELDPQFPEALQAVLLKALSKDPDTRYQTAEELREALLLYVRDERHVVSDRAVAELLEGALGGVLATRNRTLRQSAEKLRRGETLAPDVQLPASPPNSTTPGGVAKNLGAQQSGSHSASGAGVAPKTSALTLLAIASALAAFAVLAGVAYSRRGAFSDPVPAAAIATSSVVHSATAPSSEAVPAPLAPELLPLSSASAEPAEETIEPRRVRVPKSAGKPPAPVAASAQPPSPFELPARTAKPVRPPRTIDQSNPFAKP